MAQDLIDRCSALPLLAKDGLEKAYRLHDANQLALFKQFFMVVEPPAYKWSQILSPQCLGEILALIKDNAQTRNLSDRRHYTDVRNTFLPRLTLTDSAFYRVPYRDGILNTAAAS